MDTPKTLKPEADNLMSALGLSDERKAILLKHISNSFADCMGNDNRLAAVVEQACSIAEDVQELAAIATLVGQASAVIAAPELLLLLNKKQSDSVSFKDFLNNSDFDTRDMTEY